ncbi:MAG: 7TM diverse intracellular signaling domain-containing protein [Hydrogenophaga sp.]|uniref:sensor domain-containing diguanylate cyclase n=1 Tax=Hydrogenophaga sp. TaxID=1904254 RepID=UPI00273107AC|nr:7TM diverse intracellular signaling domain-containing protein [Hydrogenophaga sp.]MDP2406980.1 7TM diverse intracellular signaling domain-containing protein [Hydrogenophaga sp.]MDZ4173816.1 7TM diverse intracellular signaling domain-containing protein [Hydrogenophaga sp.]
MPPASALHRLLARTVLLLALAFVAWHGGAQASSGDQDVTLRAHYWVDPTGEAGIDTVAQAPAAQFQPMAGHRTFKLGDAALWMRLDLPAMDPAQRWFLMLDSSAFTDHASFFQPRPGGGWQEQRAGDHLAVSRWSIPDRSPVFALDDTSAPLSVWLRLDNKPAPLSPRTTLLSAADLQQKRSWTHLLVGVYLGFGLLVLFLGWVHARLYGDRAFVAYVVYVSCMLGFQVAFTGIGGQFFWPDWAWWNSAAPAVFMLWLTGSGIWFVREVCAISRYHRGLDRFALAWSVFGLLYPVAYLTLQNAAALAVLNLYGLLSVLLSIGLCLWAWRQGERYAGWMALGFLPVHLGYPFPALRAAGVLPDSWGAQYAVLIGSAIEIPLLLYILHRRAQHFSENRARLRALDSTDPLTGLTIVPVLELRLRDAIRRARRYGHHCALLLVELSNHADLRLRLGQDAGDRALVLSAARLTRVVRDVDTVCRVTDTRFAILVEGPQRPEHLKLLAQHIVAKGLEPASILPGDATLRFRLVSTLLPVDRETAAEEEERVEARRALQRMHRALDQLADEPRKAVWHLPREQPVNPALTGTPGQGGADAQPLPGAVPR